MFIVRTCEKVKENRASALFRMAEGKAEEAENEMDILSFPGISV